MKYAQIKKRARKLITQGILIWIPMMRIRYSVGNTQYDKLFDAYLYKKSGFRLFLVALIRDPSDFTFEEVENPRKYTLEPIITDPNEIMNDLIDFKESLTKKKKEIDEKIRLTPFAQAATLFIPMVGEIYSKPIDDLWIIENALSILDTLQISPDKKIDIISHELIFMPIIIDLDKKKAYEPALSTKESKSITFLLNKYKVVRKFFEQLIESLE